MHHTLPHLDRIWPAHGRFAALVLSAVVLVVMTAVAASTINAPPDPAMFAAGIAGSAPQALVQDLEDSAARLVNRELARATALYFACVGLYVVLAFLFLVYWQWMEHETPMLAVGLLSVVMALHTAAISGSLPFVLPSIVDAQTGMTIETSCYLLLNGLTAFMLWAFFPSSFRPHAKDWIGTLNTAVAALCMATSVVFTTASLATAGGGPAVLSISRWITVFLMIVVTALAIQAIESDRVYGGVTAAGLGLLVVGSIHDVLFADIGTAGRPYLITFSVLGFLLLQTYVVLRQSAEATHAARRSSHRLRREVEGRTLELRAATVAAQAANMAKSEFVTTITHELRTPLASLLGYADLIRDELRDNLTPEHAGFIDQLELSAERMLNLVNNLLDLAKIESGRIDVNIEEVDVRKVADGVCDELYPIAKEKGLYLETDVAAQNTLLRTDGQWLSVVLANLVSNAVKYTDVGGVTLHIDDANLGGRDAIAIEVIDTGFGISPDFMPLLFQRFSREEHARDGAPTGSGLGLTIARELLEHLGGRIEVNSDVDHGSAFLVLLPLEGPPGAD